MTRTVRLLACTALTVVSALVLSNCVVRARATAPVLYTPSVNATVVAQPVTTTVVTQPAYAQPAYAQPQPVVAACGQCVQGSYERCNGCDDNCNGVIDEDCR